MIRLKNLLLEKAYSQDEVNSRFKEIDQLGKKFDKEIKDLIKAKKEAYNKEVGEYMDITDSQMDEYLNELETALKLVFKNGVIKKIPVGFNVKAKKFTKNKYGDITFKNPKDFLYEFGYADWDDDIRDKIHKKLKSGMRIRIDGETTGTVLNKAGNEVEYRGIAELDIVITDTFKKSIIKFKKPKQYDWSRR